MKIENLRSIPILVVSRWLGLSPDSNNRLSCYNTASHKQGDVHPSLSLDKNKNRFKCFSCGANGSNIDLTMGYLGMEFRQASKELSKAFLSDQGPECQNGNGSRRVTTTSKQRTVKSYTLENIKRWKLGEKIFDALYSYGSYVKARYRDPAIADKIDIYFTTNNEGRYVKGRNCPPVLYNDGQLAKRPNDTICYTEGEGGVDILESLGFLATTAGSAVISQKTFTPEMISKLKGRDIVVFEDNDEPGRQVKLTLKSLLHDTVKSIRVVDIKSIWKKCFAEETPKKGDIKDFVTQYRDLNKDSEGELKQVINSMINDAKPVIEPVEGEEVGNNGNDEILEKFFIGKRFVPQFLTEEILSENDILYIYKSFHQYLDGVYRITDVDYIEQISKYKLKNLSKISYIKETVNDIKLSTLAKVNIKLNNRTDLINVRNGMYDFINHRLIKHDPKYLSCTRINAEFNENAKCPRWIKFISETISKEDSIILQEIFGYSLIADNRFEQIVFLIGQGCNGKSVTLYILMKLIGTENASKLSLLELGDRFKTAMLQNKLINVCSDIGNQTIKNTEFLKNISSGDPITAEKKHENPFDFNPYVKLLFSCNELPKSVDRTFAYYRRLILIPYTNSFTGKNQDKALKGKLENEINGILNWSLEGLDRLFKNQGFSKSKTSDETMLNYKLDNDNVLQFTNDQCIFGDKLIIDKTKLFSMYKEYCEDNGLRSLSQRRFNKDLIEKNNSVYESRNPFSNKRAWKGIGLNEN